MVEKSLSVIGQTNYLLDGLTKEIRIANVKNALIIRYLYFIFIIDKQMYLYCVL